jgi:hypothetical protein
MCFLMKRFLMRQCAHKMMSISCIFHKCFIREIRKTYTVDCVFPKLSHGIIGVFLSIHDQVPSFFPHDF